MDTKNFKPKSFWKRPEGITGAIFLGGLVIGGGFLIAKLLPVIIPLLSSTLFLAVMLVAFAALIFVALDSKARNLVWYMYKSVMRWVTGLFVQIDPIGILKSYVEDLEDNLAKMNKQINQLRGQMHKLGETIFNNKKSIKENLAQASQARDRNIETQMILKSRKAGRLKESNMRLEDLYRKMEVLYRVLSKMHENSLVLKEDIKDQVEVKEQERKAIHTSHSAMKSAMNVIAGNTDAREMFDMALEAIATDVSEKVGEMEQFMELSSNFMESLDLQNGIFEEEGMQMLEKWEKEGVSKILGEEKVHLLEEANDEGNVLDLNAPVKRPVRETNHLNQYDSFFD